MEKSLTWEGKSLGEAMLCRDIVPPFGQKETRKIDPFLFCSLNSTHMTK